MDISESLKPIEPFHFRWTKHIWQILKKKKQEIKFSIRGWIELVQKQTIFTNQTFVTMSIKKKKMIMQPSLLFACNFLFGVTCNFYRPSLSC